MNTINTADTPLEKMERKVAAPYQNQLQSFELPVELNGGMFKI